MRIVCSVAALRKWHLSKFDFKTAFLQSGDATRDVYVKPPIECKYRNRFYWLLLAATYGLVNANLKWQHAIDAELTSLGLLQSKLIPQLFYSISNNEVVLIAAKAVDDILLASPRDECDRLITKLQAKFQLSTVVHSPGTLQYFGLAFNHTADCETEIHGDDKLSKLIDPTLSRLRRKEVKDPLNEMELAQFRSLNSQLSWLGTAASPLCAFTSSHLQQRMPNATVADAVAQQQMLRSLKRFGTSIRYVPPPPGEHSISIICFADANKRD